MGRRAAIRREAEAQGKDWAFQVLVENERQGNKLRVVLRRHATSDVGSQSQVLPDIRFEVIKAVRKQLYEFICGSQEELEYPVCLTKMQRSVVHEVARDFSLSTVTRGARREEQVVVRKANRDHPSEPLVVHSGFICDGCNAVPQKRRFHCQQCEDFDFCDTCHEAWTQGNLPHAKDHTFQTIPKP